MEKDQVKRVVETLLYMADHALSAQEISTIIELKTWDEEAIAGVVKEISDQLVAQGSPLRVVEVAGGYQMATQPEMAVWIRRMYKERLTVRLSPSSLETLSIIAYKQPITRAEIEQIRGVEASGVVDTLVERRLIKTVGRKETIGRPLLYGTTSEFLRHFGLKHLSELPDLSTLAATLNAATPAAAESTSDQPELPMAEGADASSVATEDSAEPEQTAEINETVTEETTEAPTPATDLPEATPEQKELKEEVLVAENEGMTKNA